MPSLPGAPGVRRNAKGRMKLGPAVAAALANRDADQELPVPEIEKQIHKSLGIKQDTRYTKIDFFSRQCKTTIPSLDLRPATSQGFQQGRAAPASEVLPGLEMSLSSRAPGQGFQGTWHNGSSSAREGGHIGPQGSVGPQKQPPLLTGDERSSRPRHVWHDSVDRNIKRLMIDFDLSDAPQCRIHHLERMDQWFNSHGPKEKEKVSDAKEDPSYLIVDRKTRDPLPAGSTMGLTGQLSNTSELLHTLYSPRCYTSPRPSRPATSMA